MFRDRSSVTNALQLGLKFELSLKQPWHPSLFHTVKHLINDHLVLATVEYKEQGERGRQRERISLGSSQWQGKYRQKCK